MPLIDLDASSRALCERLGPVQTRGLQPEDGRRHLGHDAPRRGGQHGVRASGRRRSARARCRRSRRYCRPPNAADSPTSRQICRRRYRYCRPRIRTGARVPFGRVYTRAIRLARIQRREAFHGREPNLAALPPMVTSPAILVAWDFVPDAPPAGASIAGSAEAAPRRVFVHAIRRGAGRPELQPARDLRRSASHPRAAGAVRNGHPASPLGRRARSGAPARADSLLAWQATCRADDRRSDRRRTTSGRRPHRAGRHRSLDRARAGPSRAR